MAIFIVTMFNFREIVQIKRISKMFKYVLHDSSTRKNSVGINLQFQTSRTKQYFHIYFSGKPKT